MPANDERERLCRRLAAQNRTPARLAGRGWRPQWREAYLGCFDALTESYLKQVSWEIPETLEMRAAQLLPGILLARIDGKSPVEYIDTATDRDYVRTRAKSLLLQPPLRLAAVRAAWTRQH